MGAYKQISKAEYYRQYADELRAIADRLRSDGTRRILQNVADDFHRMANADDAAQARSLLEQRNLGVIRARDHGSYARS